MHCAHCYMPLPAAHILSVNNQLVSSATHALVERDKDDMKVSKPLFGLCLIKYTSIKDG